MHTLTLKIPDDLDAALRAASQRRQIGRSELVRQALSASLATELQETSSASRWLARWSGPLTAPEAEGTPETPDADADAARTRHLLRKHVK